VGSHGDAEAFGVSPRHRTDRDDRDCIPVHVVWELTLACNLKCGHCGSRAGRRRPSELTTEEALAVVDSMAALGTRELTVIGGEAYLRRDWTEIIARATGHGIYVGLQTGGRALTPARLQAGIDAGLKQIGVSVDGLEALHDRLRGVNGSGRAASDVLHRARAGGVRTSVNTNIGPETIAQLPALLDVLAKAGISNWLAMITVAMGNAVDHPEWLLQPYQMDDVMRQLAALHEPARAAGILLKPGNNVGYFGPYEHLWADDRDADSDEFAGCSAGHTLIGLEADGTVKGCPSLATQDFAGGNIRDGSLEAVWRRAAGSGALRPSPDLWGHCGSCYYAQACGAGCTWTAHGVLGRPGNNPYCHHRVLKLRAEGRRERIVKLQDAGPASFSVGRFALIEETLDGSPLPASEPAAAVPLRRDRPLVLDLCRGCQQYVHQGTLQCPFCGGDVPALREAHAGSRAELRRTMDDLRQRLGIGETAR